MGFTSQTYVRLGIRPLNRFVPLLPNLREIVFEVCTWHLFYTSIRLKLWPAGGSIGLQRSGVRPISAKEDRLG